MALALASCTKTAPLQDLGAVPRFELTDQAGRPFDSATLAGRVWVADLIYTTCPGPCPMMTAKMKRLQASTKSVPGVRLISFTVDPATDTPPVLEVYARKYSADESRWTFLTGEQAKLNDLGINVFHLNSVDGSMVHSTRFVVVDRQGHIRKYYASDEDGFLDNILRDVKALEASQS